LETLKELLHKTLKIAPRQKSAFKVEIVLRSQGYDLMYHHMSGDELAALMEGKAFKELLTRGFKLTRNVVMLGGHQFSWRSNDIGLPVGVGLATPGAGRYQLSYGNVSQTNKISRSIQSNIDLNLQVYQTNSIYYPVNFWLLFI
jgi:hypothetical protein